MNELAFERVLDAVCSKLTLEAQATGFQSAPQFEARVRTALQDELRGEQSIAIDFPLIRRHFLKLR